MPTCVHQSRIHRIESISTKYDRRHVSRVVPPPHEHLRRSYCPCASHVVPYHPPSICGGLGVIRSVSVKRRSLFVLSLRFLHEIAFRPRIRAFGCRCRNTRRLFLCVASLHQPDARVVSPRTTNLHDDKHTHTNEHTRTGECAVVDYTLLSGRGGRTSCWWFGWSVRVCVLSPLEWVLFGRSVAPNGKTVFSIEYQESTPHTRKTLKT